MSYIATAQSGIHAVDFKNFAYPAMCASDKPEKLIVKKGEFSKETQMDGYIDRLYFVVFDISYGDLTGDGKDEAVILSSCNTGGTGNFSEGFIFTEKAGKPILIARIPGGDRAYGGLRTAFVENGILFVESNDPGENGANCCPEMILRTRYKLAGGRITALGKPDKREIYPTQRVNFARGTSGTTFSVVVPRGEGKRYIVGARAGQTLKVSTGSDKVSLRLLEDAEMTEGINNFAAKLPKNGDYTVEIQNNADTDIEITLNIKIQ